MHKVTKRVISFLLIVALLLCSDSLSKIGKLFDSNSSVGEAVAVEASPMFNATGLVLGDDHPLTRAEWLHDLAVLFSMEVTEDEAPDNYFADVVSSDKYYTDILLNVEFGVIDIPAGGKVYPDAPATREFCGTTLNYCLGFVYEGDEYSFSDYETVPDPAACQIAINRKWFSLVEGCFCPNASVSTDEINVMITDARIVLNTVHIDENAKNSCNYSDEVKILPSGLPIAIDLENNLFYIVDTDVELAAGDYFAAVIDGLPVLYYAQDVTPDEDMLVVSLGKVENTELVTGINSQGSLPISFKTDQDEYLSEGGELHCPLYYGYVDGAEKPAFFADEGEESLSVSYKIKEKLNGYTTVTGEVGLSNVYFGHKASDGELLLTLSGDVGVSLEVEAGQGDSVEKFKGELPFGIANIGGIGVLTISAVYEVSGSVKYSQNYHFKVGVQITDDNCRIIHDFKKDHFTVIINANVKIGIKVEAKVTIAVAEAGIALEVGAKGKGEITLYTDGAAPSRCTDINGFTYAEVTASAEVRLILFKITFEKTLTIWDMNNAPIYFAMHFEDARMTNICARTVASKENGVFFTPISSKYYVNPLSNQSSKGYNEDGSIIELFTYTVDDNNEATITGYNGKARTLNIPEYLDGYKVVAIGKCAFYRHNEIITVIIPNSVKSIGTDAFYYCTSLKYITLPNGLEEIGTETFTGCVFEKINIPKSLKKTNGVGSPFRFCGKLKYINFENGITEILPYLFYDCDGLVSVVIPNSVTKIGNFAFKECNNLKDIKLSSSLVEIGDVAFGGCSSLQDFAYPDSITKIGNGAFSSCHKLTKAILPKNLEVLGEEAYWYCSNLKTVFIPKTLTTVNGYKSPFGGMSALKNVTIEDGIKTIPSTLFKKCAVLETIVIPSSVEKIENEAFQYCESLNNVIIPSSVKEIGTRAFANDTSLSEIYLSDSLKTVGEQAFIGCTSLTEIILPDSLETIESYAFADCRSLKNVKMGNGIASLKASGIFSGCSSLETLMLPHFLQSIDFSIINGCTGLNTIFIPSTVKDFSGGSCLGSISEIHGGANSPAEQYAQNNNKTFVADFTYYGALDLKDVGELAKYLANYDYDSNQATPSAILYAVGKEPGSVLQLNDMLITVNKYNNKLRMVRIN